jgi:orotidine-5'-phosphate decarboxylase
MTRDEARSKIIFALDFDTFNAAKHWVSLLSGRVGMFKVGKQLFTAYGPDIVRMIGNFSTGVFLDLKYHDIPNTVAMASREAARLRVKLFNLHALGGYEMMSRTVETINRDYPGQDRPGVLAVTILTSSSQETLGAVGIDRPVEEMVVRLALLAQKAGIDGVVASPREVPMIREACGRDFLIVTPGVRPTFASVDDQKRVMTPAEAVTAGSDFLVIGRPISAAPDPLRAVEAIVDEIAGKFSGS